MKIRLVWSLAGLAVLASVVLGASSFSPIFRSPHELLYAEEALPEDAVIQVRTSAESIGIRKGDAFSYELEVRYDPQQVSEVDRTTFDSKVDLSPFELRGTNESEFDVDARTRVYRRKYELQLINGQTNHLYTFPSIVVRYLPKGSPGFLEKTIEPEPVYVVSRLPEDASKMTLKPLKGQIVDENRRNLPWWLWALGGCLGLLGAGDLVWRVMPKCRATNNGSRTAETGDVLVQAYRSLYSNIELGTQPERTLRQINYILKLVMVRQGQCGWLDEARPDQVPEAIRAPLVSLADECRPVAGDNASGQQHVTSALGWLDELLAFYYGAEVDAWKN